MDFCCGKKKKKPADIRTNSNMSKTAKESQKSNAVVSEASSESGSEMGSRNVDIFNFKTIEHPTTDSSAIQVGVDAVGPDDIRDGKSKDIFEMPTATRHGNGEDSGCGGDAEKGGRPHVQLDPVGRVVKARKDKLAVEARKSHKRDNSVLAPPGQGKKNEDSFPSVEQTIHVIGGHLIDKKTKKQVYVEAGSAYEIKSQNKSSKDQISESGSKRKSRDKADTGSKSDLGSSGGRKSKSKSSSSTTISEEDKDENTEKR